MTDRFAAEVVAIAGRKAKVGEHLRSILGDPASPRPAESTAATGTPAPAPLPDLVKPAWRVRFGDSVTAGMTGLEQSQWEENSLGLAVPRVAIAGSTLYVNYLGNVFAVDLVTGKMLWRSGSFHHVDVAAMSDHARMVDASRFAVLAGLGYVWDLSRDIKDANYQATAHLTCRRAENGEIAWQTTKLPDYTGIDLVGVPILADDTLIVAGKSSANNNGQESQAHQFVLAIRPHDGKLLWKTEVGSFREAQQFYYYQMSDSSPQPRLTYHAGSIYIDTHVGVLVRLDAKSGAGRLGLWLPDRAGPGAEPLLFPDASPDGDHRRRRPIADRRWPDGQGGQVRPRVSDRPGPDEGCLGPADRPGVAPPWGRRQYGVPRRPRPERLRPPDQGAPVVVAPCPAGARTDAFSSAPTGCGSFTPRGIFEVDPPTGRVRRIFRGDDGGDAGGDLVLVDRWLITVSNQTISAYPRGQAGAGANRAAGAEPANPKTRGSDD